MYERRNLANVVLNCSLLMVLVLALTAGGLAQDASPVIAEPVDQTDGLKIEPPPEGKDSPESGNLITATTYAFAALSGVPLENMSTGTTQLLGPSLDDTASPVTNIAFDFWFDGVRHTQFSCNANGLCRLGSTVVTTTFTNALATVTAEPKITPYWDDLCTGSDGKVHFKVVGSPGSRKLVIEWQNVKITRNGTCVGAVGNGTFQLWLFETTGVIQSVYGELPASAAADNGYSIGIQSGAATNFASVTTTPPSVSYTTANDAQTNAIPAGTSYTFTPNVPAAPSNLTFGTPGATSNVLNWTDNSSNEVGFAIYRSTDGANYVFTAQTAANAVTFTDTSLTPSTNYFYRIFAVTEGALSTPPLAGSRATTAGGTDTCAGAGGDYSNPATWADGSVPTENDSVTIQTGCTVTVDTATALALNVTINAGGTLRSPLAGTVVTNNLTVGGNLINNGTLDFSTNSDTSGAILTFGAGGFNTTFGGSGATTDVRAITIARGAPATTVELTATNFTVQGVNTDVAGFLTLTSGTFKISGSFTMTNRIFTTAGYTIPAPGGLWLNNSNFTVAGQNGSPTNTGLLRLTSGAYNVGTATGNSLGGGSAGGEYIIEGGTLNIAGRLQTASTASYTQSGGTVNVCTIGNTAVTACFGLSSGTNTFNLTGGTIVLVLPSGAATPLDYSVSPNAISLANPAGTTLQIGNAATPAGSTFRVTGNTPNILINSGQTMNVGSGTGAAIFFRGSTVINNGAIGVQGTGSRFDFAASGPMTYGGTGTFGTAAASFAGVGMSANSPTGNNTTINSPIFINRVNVFNGGFTGSNQITLGNGGTSTTVIQVGNNAAPTNAGTFDVSPVYNTGSGGHVVLSLRTTTLNRVTGFEINPTRTLASWTIDDNAVGGTLTIAGGNLTINAAMTLTNGVIQAGSNTITHNGAVTRTNGYIVGTLNRVYTAGGSYIYHVGANGYSPVTTSIATVTVNPSSLSVRPVDDFLPGVAQATGVSRYWTLTEVGDLTASLSFTYLDADINGDEAMYKVFRRAGGVTAEVAPSTPNPAANSISVTGITNFSDWGVGTSLAPTQAFASISGRATREDGYGLPRVTVVLSNSQGVVQTTQTNGFGYYFFSNIGTGVNYTVSVSAKVYTFNPSSRQVTLNADVTDVNFSGTGSLGRAGTPKKE